MLQRYPTYILFLPPLFCQQILHLHSYRSQQPFSAYVKYAILREKNHIHKQIFSAHLNAVNFLLPDHVVNFLLPVLGATRCTGTSTNGHTNSPVPDRMNRNKHKWTYKLSCSWTDAPEQAQTDIQPHSIFLPTLLSATNSCLSIFHRTLSEILKCKNSKTPSFRTGRNEEAHVYGPSNSTFINRSYPPKRVSMVS